MTASRQRIDRLLVERGLFESRTKAQAAIEAGLVTVDGRMAAKPSEEIPVDAKLQASAVHPYVSRGGVKLTAALDHFHVDPKDRVCLDVGASTGGFTQVLLERGANRIYAVDNSMSPCGGGAKSCRWKTPIFVLFPRLYSANCPTLSPLT